MDELQRAAGAGAMLVLIELMYLTNPKRGRHGVEPSGHRLWGVLDMLRVYPQEYISLSDVIHMFEQHFKLKAPPKSTVAFSNIGLLSGGDEAEKQAARSRLAELLAKAQPPMTPAERERADRQWMLTGLDLLRWPCARLQLSNSVAMIDKRKADPPQSQREVQQLLELIQEEAVHRIVLLVSPSKAEWHNKADLLSSEAKAKFSQELVAHVMDGATCYALDQTNACVYHLVGALDLAFKGIAKSLNKTIDIYDKTLDWGKIQDTIHEATRAKAKASPAWAKKYESVYEDIKSDIRAIAKTIRNPASHYRVSFTDKDAIKLLHDVPSFLEHYAQTLKAKRPRA